MDLPRLKQWCEEHRLWIIAGVFLVIVLVGWFVCTDYAFSNDEPSLFAYSQQAWQYLFAGGPEPTASDWKFHTPVYQFIFTAYTLLFQNDPYIVFMTALRFTSFLVFCVGWLSLFFLAKRLTKNEWWALLVVLWIVISPRMFAHAFYNPKDLPTLTSFTLSILMLVRMLENPTPLRIGLFGLAAGFAISLRPFALLLPCFSLLFCVVYALTAETGEERKRWWLVGAGSVVATAILTVVVWPRLWSDPIGHMLTAITDNTSRGDEGFYFGVHLTKFPWHYLPVWMGITIPAAYSALFLVGFTRACTFLRRPLTLMREQPVIALALLWFCIPVAARLAGCIGLFDEWRHLLFLYPAFLLFALLGAHWLWTVTKGKVRLALAALVVLQMLATFVWMVRFHPYEYAYFSVPSSWVKGQMEMDYWGMSYADGLRWIAANDKTERIPVYIRNDVGVNDMLLISDADRKRLYPVKSSSQAMYIVDILRWSGYKKVVPDSLLVHTIDVDGLPILWIYKGPYATPELPDYKYEVNRFY